MIFIFNLFILVRWTNNFLKLFIINKQIFKNKYLILMFPLNFLGSERSDLCKQPGRCTQATTTERIRPRRHHPTAYIPQQHQPATGLRHSRPCSPDQCHADADGCREIRRRFRNAAPVLPTHRKDHRETTAKPAEPIFTI